MFTTISFSSLILILILGFVFRKVVRKAANELPEAAGDVLSSASAACRALNENVLVLTAENAVDVRIKAKEIAARAEEADVAGINVTELYQQIIGKK